MAKSRTKERFMHTIPVFTNAGECGWLVLWKKVPDKVLAELEDTLPDQEDSFSEEEGLGLFFPDALHDDGLDVIESCYENVVWCQDCVEGHPCSAWTVDFDAEGFMPRDPESSESFKSKASAGGGKPFNLKAWIAERKAEWAEYKEVYEDVADIAKQFFEAAKEVRASVAAPPGSMSAAEAATVLGVSWPCDDETLKAAFKKAAMKAHPDREGGSAEKMKRVIAARDALQGS